MKFTTDSILIEGSVGGGLRISFHTQDMDFSQDLMHKYDGIPYEVTFKPKKANRSLDANAYLWVLCGKIASHKDILISKTDVYRKAIQDYGVSTVMPVKDDLLEDILRWHKSEDRIGNDYRVLGKSKFDGYTNVCFFYGSSQYDTKSMAILIDGVVADAKELGIETMTPDEIERIKQEWQMVG